MKADSFDPALAALSALAAEKGPVIAAVDGRCGSGKTTLAALAQEKLGCAVVHMDGYYLPFAQRAADWKTVPGGNMDFARLRREVLEPFLAGRPALCRPYICRTDAWSEPWTVPAGGMLLVEGSYAHHPALADLYGLRLFLTCAPAVQERRLRAREGAHFDAFRQTWIPLEEAYIRRYDVGRDCLVVDTGESF